MPEYLTPSQLAALRHHIEDGGALGNGNARALLATLDEMIGQLVEVALLLDSWAPCHRKGETAKLVQTYRAFLPKEPETPCPSTSPLTSADAQQALDVLATDPGIGAAHEAAQHRKSAA